MTTYRPASVLLEAKHPREEVNYALPFGPWLADGQTISGTPSIDVQAGLTLTPEGRPAPTVIDGTDLVFWLGGGESGATYQGEILAATTGGGPLLVVSFLIEVVDPTPAVPEA
jgi:hypothetical protein